MKEEDRLPDTIVKRTEQIAHSKERPIEAKDYPRAIIAVLIGVDLGGQPGHAPPNN